jgi:hypothetical protein
MLRSNLGLALVIAVVVPSHAAAESISTRHAPGVTVGATLLHGENTDDLGVDFERGQYGGVQLGYRFANGLEPFLAAAASTNIGREDFALVYGAGVRARLGVGPVEPFAEIGVFSVGDGAPAMWAAAVGAGVDVPLGRRLSIGVAGGHYLNDDDDTRGGLDWYGRAQLTYRFGD